MPKKKHVSNSMDTLARRLSYTGVEENGYLIRNITRPRTVENSVYNYSTEIKRRAPVESASESELRGVFPKVVYFILAMIAASFLFSRTVHKLFSYSLTDILYPLTVAFILGVLCMVFSWMVTFSDSLEPGSNPPSPISPQKLRKLSGHTFHSSYVICIANGVITFAVSLWYFSK